MTPSTCARGYYVGFLCACIVLASGRAETDFSNNTVVTNCSSAGVILKPAPLDHVLVLEADFGSGAPLQEVNCSWIIAPADNQTSNAVSFLFPASTAGETHAWCQTLGNSLTLYDQDLESGNTSYIDDVCRRNRSIGWYSGAGNGLTNNTDARRQIPTGRRGYRTVVRFTASQITQSRLPLVSYGSLAWHSGHCGTEIQDEITNNINVTEQQVTLEIPDQFHRLPNKAGCLWDIKSFDPKNVLHLRIVSNGRAGQAPPGDVPTHFVTTASHSTNTSLFLILTPGFPVLNKELQVPLTDKGLDFSFVALGGAVVMSFEAGEEGGAPPFNITFWTDSFDALCPNSSSPLSLAATAEPKVFKGVNHDPGLTISRECGWNITAPEGLVVQLVSIYNKDYLLYPTSNEYLLIVTALSKDGKKVEMTSSVDFPMWSSGTATSVQFQPSSSSPRRQFFITYKTVPPAECQGHPIALNVLRNLTTVTGLALSTNDTVHGTDCRWLLETQTGRPFQATVRLLNQSIDCSNSSYVWGRQYTLSAYFTNTPKDFDTRIFQTCVQDKNAWVVNSRSTSNVTLIVFNRRPDVSFAREGVVIEFAELPDLHPTGTSMGTSSIALAAAPFAMALCLTAILVLP